MNKTNRNYKAADIPHNPRTTVRGDLRRYIPMIKKIDCNLTQEQYEDVIRYIVIAFKRFIKKETGGKGSILETPYAALADMNKKVDCSLVALAAVNAVMYCQLHDEYYEAYYEQNPDVERTEPMLRKKIEESVFPRLKKGTPNVKNFQVRISKMVFNEYALLSLFALYPQADNAAEALKMLFTEIEFIANNSKMNAYNSGMGGKRGALCHLKGIAALAPQHSVQALEAAPNGFNGLNTSKIECTTIAEAFARTIAISLSFFDNFAIIDCGDTDFRLVNYYYVIEKWFDEFVESIKKQFSNLASSSDIQEGFKRLKKICKDVKSTYCKADRIAAAAALYIIINTSFSGNEKNAVPARMENFEDKLNKRISDLKYLSANMKKITYVKRDFRKTIEKYLNDPSVLLILDPPYLKEFGLPCKDYVIKEVDPNKKNEEKPFTYEDMLDMFKLLKNAKCKVILFHSRSYWFDSTAVSYGLHKVGYYVGRNIGKKYKPYYTEVYSLNIDPSVKFFEPKNHGELYWGGCE